jgi:hypothetical protein
MFADGSMSAYVGLFCIQTVSKSGRRVDGFMSAYMGFVRLGDAATSFQLFRR